ncbi:MAG TPA: TIGR02266 family protein [Myxococcales bacterium]|nr:TIGR02266 family protein [Myxococcales bacterium]
MAPRPFVVPVRFAVGTQVLQATTGALGVDCAFVRCVVPPRPGERIAMRLYLAEEQPLQVTAAVRARSGSETAMGFWADFVPDKMAQARIARALGLVEQTARPMDRRAMPRYAARFAVRFGTVEEFRREYATNISVGGLFIRTNDPPLMEAVVTVSLELPGGAPVEGKAVVVHRVTPEEAAQRKVDPGVGVQFVHGDDAFRDRIDRFVASLSVRGTG